MALFFRTIPLLYYYSKNIKKMQEENRHIFLDFPTKIYYNTVEGDAYGL